MQPADRMAEKAVASLKEALGKEALGEEPLPSPLTEKEIRLWLSHMLRNGAGTSTVRRYYGKLQALARKAAGAEAPLFPRLGDILPDIGKSPPQAPADEAGSRIKDPTPEDLRTLARKTPSPETDLLLYSFCAAGLPFADLVRLRIADAAPVTNQGRAIVNRNASPRRRFLFPLRQGRVSDATIVRDLRSALSAAVANHGTTRGAVISDAAVRRLWTEAALACGIAKGDIRAILGPAIPSGCDHLAVVEPSQLAAPRRLEILQRVADSILDSSDHWYALRLRRTRDYLQAAEEVSRRLERLIPDAPGVFYPCGEIHRRVGRKILTRQEAFIPYVIFVRTAADRVAAAVSAVNDLAWGYRNSRNTDSAYSIIADRQMRDFQFCVGRFTADMQLSLAPIPADAIGRRVRVTAGQFAGYEGIIYDQEADERDPSLRIFMLRLTTDSAIRWEAAIDETLLEEV